MRNASETKAGRAMVKGKFIVLDEEKFYIKGVTYGTFAPNEKGEQFPPDEEVEKDFRLMVERGINTVRTYTAPPKRLLDLAENYGLKVMIGLPWEQHITFLDERERVKNIHQSVRQMVLDCAQHPAILCFAVGNEIPAPIVRWYGKRKIEKFLKDLYQTVKEADPGSLVTYVNYPTTEYLDLSFMDFDCFNVYLETPEKLEKYLARLHNLCGERPLVLAEIGLDSMRNGLDKQAEVLDWQIRTVFGRGCAGTFVFAWTDEWWRGGFPIEDWDFGLVDRERQPKPALDAVEKAFAQVPFAPETALPRFSVVVCTYNGSATIRDTMEGLLDLDYPNYEVIVVNDGSKDHTADIVAEYPFRLINTPNRGLSNARNTGMRSATGDIVAYIDDDAYPDPQWLRYLAFAYLHSDFGGMGGPNLAPEEDGPVAVCVANSPGGPVHVLLDDEVAEHIPGCNMSFRREVLLEIEGLDPRYRAAGDDVDLCWRVQRAGYKIGFHPSALVWHHRRSSMRTYWKQQQGYGKAEALLEEKWPERYNKWGHLNWGGKIYGNGLTLPLHFSRERVRYGTWGTGLFQSVYASGPRNLAYLPLMPEWYLMIGLLAVVGTMGLLWPPLFLAWPLAVLSFGIVLAQSGLSAARAIRNNPGLRRKGKLKFGLVIAFLHVLQPLARLIGRLKHGLTPWRVRGMAVSLWNFYTLPSSPIHHWSETWKSAEEWLEMIKTYLIRARNEVKVGHEFANWDLEARSGFFSRARALLVVEEHGSGHQYLKLKTWPVYSLWGFLEVILLAVVGALAAFSGAWIVSITFWWLALILSARYFLDARRALFNVQRAFRQLEGNLALVSDEARQPDAAGEFEILFPIGEVARRSYSMETSQQKR